MSVPKQRNTKEENEAIKAGKTPEGWEKQPAKNAQKDKDARWTKKNDESFYGYKNHLGVDKVHKLIRKWDATDASVHDSQKLDDMLDLSNTGRGVWADSAYRSAQIEADLKAKGLQSRIHRRAARKSSAVRAPEVGEHDALEGARPCRARIRPPAEFDGRQDRAHHRHRAGEVQDRDDESRLQHPPAGPAQAGGGCARLKRSRVESVWRRAKGPRSPAKRQKRPRSRTHLGTSAATARSAKAEIAESEYCSRFPLTT